MYKPLAASNRQYLEGLGDAYSVLGGTEMRSGMLQQALGHYQENLKIREQPRRLRFRGA